MKLIRKKTVASVLAGFSKLIDELNKIADVETKAITTKEGTVSKLNAEIGEHAMERARALNAAAKIEGLLS